MNSFRTTRGVYSQAGPSRVPVAALRPSIPSCVHPETGERALVHGRLVQYFTDIPKCGGHRLFDLFHISQHPKIPCARAGRRAMLRSRTTA